MDKRRILIVDDEVQMRKKYKKVLMTAKFSVIEAPRAIDVANILMREKSSLDLIVLDINMPEVDGREIYEIIQEYAPELPIIVSSVLPVREQKIRMSKAVDYYNKADDPDVLVKKARKAVGVETPA